LMSLATLVVLSQAAPAPKAEPKAFFIPVGSVALPALTGSALVDGLLLGKVAFLKAAILANLLLGSEDEAPVETYGAPVDSYGAPADSYGAPVDTYGPPAVSYDAPEPAYGAPAAHYDAPEPSYDAPAVSYEEPVATYEQVDTYGPPAAPVVDTYGSPAAPAVDSYGAPSYN